MAHVCAVLPTSKKDALELGLMSRVDVPGKTCFWIDQTEVSVEEYRIWQDHIPVNAVDWDETLCSWKTVRGNPALNPDDACSAHLAHCGVGDVAADDPFAPRRPMRCVDWCEAEAFCRWKGQRLCRDAPADRVEWLVGGVREWWHACTNGGSTRNPWGDSPSSGRCNTGDNPSAGVCPSAVGAETACTSNRDVADLIGNVAEWVSGCGPADNGAPGCLSCGGGYARTAPDSCNSSYLVRDLDERAPDLGFRCCASLTADEEAHVQAGR